MNDETLGTERRRRWRSPNKRSGTAYAPMPGYGERRAEALRRKIDEEKAAEQAPKKKGGSDMSNMEWGLLFGVALSVDIGQWLLDNVAVIGLAFNWLIDIFMGMFLAFWFWYRGVKPTIAKGMFQLAMTGIEVIGDGELPFWWLDVAIMYVLDKADNKLENLVGKVPFAGKITSALGKGDGI